MTITFTNGLDPNDRAWLEARFMALQDEIDALTSAFANASNRINASLTNLNGQVDDLTTQVTDLKKQLQNAGASGDQQNAIQAVIDGLNNLDIPAPMPPPQTVAASARA